MSSGGQFVPHLTSLLVTAQIICYSNSMNENMEKKRLLTGIKPTGNIHLGNYFGMMRKTVELQDDYDCFIFIADLHALNQIQDADQMRENILEIAKAYLAVGLDPEKVTLFKQSEISEVAELCWILDSIASMGMLERAHAYKDAKAKNKSVSMGLFNYPVLMASDILLYSGQVVPVGSDQQQHIEMAVDLAERFNHIYGDCFVMPEALISEDNLSDNSVVVGLDGQKMSKSYNNVIGLFDTPEEIHKKVMSIKTDSKAPNEPKDPETCNVFAFYKLVASPEELDELRVKYEKCGIGYKDAKELLYEKMMRFLEPIQDRKAELDANPEYVFNVLNSGAERAKEIAKVKILEIKTKVGLK